MAAQGDDSDAESDCSALSSLSTLDARWRLAELAPPRPVPSELATPTPRLEALPSVEPKDTCLGCDLDAQGAPSTRCARPSSPVPRDVDARFRQVNSGSENQRCTVEAAAGIAMNHVDESAKASKENKKRSKSKKSKKRPVPRDDDCYEGQCGPTSTRTSIQRDCKRRGGSQAVPIPQATPTSPTSPRDASLARTDAAHAPTKRTRLCEAEVLRSDVAESTLELAGLSRSVTRLLEISGTPPTTGSLAAPSVPHSSDGTADVRPLSRKERRKERKKAGQRDKPNREVTELSRDFYAISTDSPLSDKHSVTRNSKRRLESVLHADSSDAASPIASTSAAQQPDFSLTTLADGDINSYPATGSAESRNAEREEGKSRRARRELTELSRDVWAVQPRPLAEDQTLNTRAAKRPRRANPASADSSNEGGGLLAPEPPVAGLAVDVDVDVSQEAKSRKVRRKERRREDERKRKRSKKGSGGMQREVAELKRDFYAISADALAQGTEAATENPEHRRAPVAVASPPDRASTSAAPPASPADVAHMQDEACSSPAEATPPDASASLRRRSSRQTRPTQRLIDSQMYAIVRRAEMHEAQELRSMSRNAVATASSSPTMDGPSQPGDAMRQAKTATRPTLPPLKSLHLPMPPLGQPHGGQRPQPSLSSHAPLRPPVAKAPALSNAFATTISVSKNKKGREAVPIVPTDPTASSPQPQRDVAPVVSTSRAKSTPQAVAPVPEKKPSKPSTVAKTRIRHPALDSRASWVEPEKNLTLTKDGRPPIWCEGRQELCETLSYFKSYQGGHYDSQERCLGYLLDGFGSANDVCTNKGKIIISHGGGCGEVVPVTSAPSTSKAKASSSSTIKTADASYIYRLKSSQTRDNLRLRALFNCLETQTPVVLLAGTGWTFFPKLSSLGSKIDESGEEVDRVRYAVLGHYLVTDIWPEGEPTDDNAVQAKGQSAPAHFVRFKIRFEWVPSQGKPWFEDHIGDETPTKQATPTPSSPGSDAASLDSGFVDVTESIAEQAKFVTCEVCQQTHRRVYQENVSCYNEACASFFLVDGRMHHPSSLSYHPSILAPSDLPQDTLVPQQLFPRTLQALSGGAAASDYSAEAWRGFGCTACGRLSSRADWFKLKCAGCGAEGNAMGKALTVQDLRTEQRLDMSNVDKVGASGYRPMKPAYRESSMDVREILHIPGWEGYTVEMLPPVATDEGSASNDVGVGRTLAHHLWPIDNMSATRADILFDGYQGAEAGELFRRNKLSRHHAVGGLLCQQFTFNAGEHYRNAITATTYPFPPAAPASSSSESPAAEEETTYAPECARDARDHLKAVVQLLVGPNTFAEFNEILSVAYMSGGKMNYHDDGERGLGPFVASVSLGSDAVMTFRAKGKKKMRAFGGGAGRTGKKSKRAASTDEAADDAEDGEGKQDRSRRIVCKMRLRHGDVMVMEGEEMQRLFEHKVEPEGLRYAATARFIGRDHLNPGPKPRTQLKSADSRFAYQDNSSSTSPTPPPASNGASTSNSPYSVPPNSLKPAGASVLPTYMRQEDAHFFPPTVPSATQAANAPNCPAMRPPPTFIERSSVPPPEWSFGSLPCGPLPPLPPSVPNFESAQPSHSMSQPRHSTGPPVPSLSANPLAYPSYSPPTHAPPTPVAVAPYTAPPVQVQAQTVMERRQAGLLAQNQARMQAPWSPHAVQTIVSMFPSMFPPMSAFVGQ